MKKVKLFFVAAALCLVTIGVFAGKKNFSNFVVYYYDDVSTFAFVPVTSSFGTMSVLNINNVGSPAYIKVSSGHEYPLYATDGGSEIRLYSNF